jgi:hypothetical protein
MPMEAENPTKDNFCMWFLNKKVLLTRDNLAKRIRMGVQNVVSVTLEGDG